MYEWRDDLDIGAAYTYMDAGDEPVNQGGGLLRGGPKGELDSANFHIFALHASWNFLVTGCMVSHRNQDPCLNKVQVDALIDKQSKSEFHKPAERCSGYP